MAPTLLNVLNQKANKQIGRKIKQIEERQERRRRNILYLKNELQPREERNEMRILIFV